MSSAGGVKPRVAVVGGGISGLAVAHRLFETGFGRDAEIALFESSDRLGGNVRTRMQDGFLIEEGPDSFFSENPCVRSLADRLGLGDEIIETHPEARKVYVVRRGRLVEIPKGFHLAAPTDLAAFAASPLFSLRGKLRALLEIAVPKGREADESLAAFVRRRFGKEVLHRVAEPLLGGIYGVDVERLSVRMALPRFKRIESEKGSVLLSLLSKPKTAASAPRPGFLTFRSGMERLTTALAASLPAGVARTGARLEAVERTRAGKWALFSEKNEMMLFDAVCLAVPALRAASLLKGSIPTLCKKVQGIGSVSATMVYLAYRKDDLPPMRASGFVVPSAEGLSISGCTLSSRKFPYRAPSGHELVRVFMKDADGVDSDEGTVAKARRDLKKVLRVDAAPAWTLVLHHPSRLTRYEVGYVDRVEAVTGEAGRFPGLYLTGHSFHAPGIPACVDHAEKTADRIARESAVVRERSFAAGSA